MIGDQVGLLPYVLFLTFCLFVFLVIVRLIVVFWEWRRKTKS